MAEKDLNAVPTFLSLFCSEGDHASSPRRTISRVSKRNSNYRGQ